MSNGMAKTGKSANTPDRAFRVFEVSFPSTTSLPLRCVRKRRPSVPPRFSWLIESAVALKPPTAAMNTIAQASAVKRVWAIQYDGTPENSVKPASAHTVAAMRRTAIPRPLRYVPGACAPIQ
jgi:hypothetical protein